MLDDHHNNRGSNGGGDDDDVTEVREIHALTSPQPSSLPLPPTLGGRSTSSSLSIGSSDAENFTTMSREFSAMVVAGSTMQSDHDSTATTAGTVDVATANLGMIGEEEMLLEETNPLAIVPDSNPIASPRRAAASSLALSGSDNSSSSHQQTAAMEEMSVHRVKKEEVESKIAAWQTAEIAKINNRFKREDVVINGWESEQVEKASAWLKKVERKLDEQRARAVEKMQNDVAKARRKAEEKRASAEAKRGTKVAKVFELSNLLRAVGRAPSKRSFF